MITNNQLFTIAQYYNSINDMDILDIHLKALSLRMCKLGKTENDSECGFTCKNCNWVHLCSEVNKYLESKGEQ